MTTHSSYVIKNLVQLLRLNADQAFGLMGNGNAHFIDEMIKQGFEYTAVRHEAATIAAADAYTRISGKIAIATTTYGAGFTNSLTSLAEAIKARTPMLVVVGDAPISTVRDIDVDQEMLTAALGTRHYRLEASNVIFVVEKAIKHALRVRKPVVISIPYDLVRSGIPPQTEGPVSSNLEIDDPKLLAQLSRAVMGEALQGDLISSIKPESRHTSAEPVSISSQQIVDALEILRTAKRPLVLAGRGAHLSGAKVELSEIAKLLGAPTASTALARGLFENLPFDLGITGGFGTDISMAIIKKADVVLVVGASLNQFTTRFGELFGSNTTIVRIDIEQVHKPETIDSSSQILVQGDAKELLNVLLKELREKRHVAAVWREQIAEKYPGGVLSHRETGETENPDGICHDGLLDPRQVAKRIATLLPEDIHITQDGGHFIGWANMFFPVPSPERMLMVGTAYQTIGLGFATVAGVAKAAPESTVVLSTGDGGGLMALADLESAIRNAKSLVIIVWNDAAYGAEVHLYGKMGLNEDPMKIPVVNFAELAEALGAKGVRIDSLTDLDVMSEWKKSGSNGTLLLDCRISPSVVAPYQHEIQRVNGI